MQALKCLCIFNVNTNTIFNLNQFQSINPRGETSKGRNVLLPFVHYAERETGNLPTKQLTQFDGVRHIAHAGILKSCSTKPTDDILTLIQQVKKGRKLLSTIVVLFSLSPSPCATPIIATPIIYCATLILSMIMYILCKQTEASRV